MLYESSLVGAFNYMWGYQDARENRKYSPALISNAQNPWDEMFGDLIGNVNKRFFLIEFKKERKGFPEEVHSGRAKPSRQELYKHLRDDALYMRISRFGHFAAWADNHDLIFSSYAHTVGPGDMRSSRFHELDYPVKELNFKIFYDAINEPDFSRNIYNKWLFGEGLGVSGKAMYKYLDFMLNIGLDKASARKKILFCQMPKSGAIEMIPKSLKDLLESFKQYKRLIKEKAPQSFVGKGQFP